MKNLEIQVIEFMIMLIRSPERIFNPMQYTGNKCFNVITDECFFYG